MRDIIEEELDKKERYLKGAIGWYNDHKIVLRLLWSERFDNYIVNIETLREPHHYKPTHILSKWKAKRYFYKLAKKHDLKLLKTLERRNKNE